MLPIAKRLTIEGMKSLFHRSAGTIKAYEDDGSLAIIRTGLRALDPAPQVFDFGRIPNLDIDKKLAGELWSKKLLRLPFPTCIFTFAPHEVRITLLLIGDASVEVGGAEEVQGATALFVISQPQEHGPARLDAFSWFDVPDPDHIKTGATQLSRCQDETEASFRSYCMTCVGKVLWLSMLLNTKGPRQRHEPIPVKLNQKRARSGKEPLDAVTYVDLSGVSFGSNPSNKGHEMPMHFRRGHIRHFDDGSMTWVKDTIVKADGQLRERARYQLR